MKKGATSSLRRFVAVAAVAAAGAAGCRHAHRPDQPVREPPVVVREPAADSPDQLPEDVILETHERAFGLALPEGMTTTKELWNNVVVVGTRPLDDVVAYVRDRVDAEELDQPGSVSFLHAKVRSPNGAFSGSLRIDVERRGDTTVLSFWGEPDRTIARGADEGAPSR